MNLCGWIYVYLTYFPLFFPSIWGQLKEHQFKKENESESLALFPLFENICVYF